MLFAAVRDSTGSRYPHGALIDANSSILAKARDIAGKVRLPDFVPAYA